MEATWKFCRSCGAPADTSPAEPVRSDLGVRQRSTTEPTRIAVALEWRSNLALKVLVSIALGLVAAASLHLALRLNDRATFAAGSFHTQREAVRLDDAVQVASLIVLGLSLVAAVVFLVWMWRSAKNALALGRDHPRFSPGWSVGAWFIPLANLVIPVLIVQDLWRAFSASDFDAKPWRSQRGSTLIGVWWASCILVAISPRLVTSSSGAEDSFDAVQSSNQLAASVQVWVAITAVLAIAVVRKLTDAQEIARQTQAAAARRSNKPTP